MLLLTHGRYPAHNKCRVSDITSHYRCPSAWRARTMTDMGRTEIQDIARRLAIVPAFSNCSTRDLADIARHAGHTSVPANWPLIHEETPGDACYVILEGKAEVAIGGAAVATLDAGSVVGEMALATGRLRNATVTSTTPLELLHIDAAEFDKLLGRRPALREALLARMKAVAATA